MSVTRPDPPGLRLDSVSYERLRQQVLGRDSWRCQSCGAMSNIEVHHKQFRSHSGDDSEENQRSWDLKKRRRHRSHRPVQPDWYRPEQLRA